MIFLYLVFLRPIRKSLIYYENMLDTPDDGSSKRKKMDEPKNERAKKRVE